MSLCLSEAQAADAMAPKRRPADILFIGPDGTIVATSYEDPSDGGNGISVPSAISKAIDILSRAGQPLTFALDVTLARPFGDDTDTKAIRNWLERRHADSDALDVIVELARAVRSEWKHLPRHTTTEHRQLFDRIINLCVDLRGAINETGSVYFASGGHGLMSATVRDLLSKSEWARLTGSARASSGRSGGERRDDRFPSVDDILRRLADAAGKLKASGPLHRQPGKRGAEHGYFVRRMGQLFAQEYGTQPKTVIAALTRIALGDEIDREVVGKLLKRQNVTS